MLMVRWFFSIEGIERPDNCEVIDAGTARSSFPNSRLDTSKASPESYTSESMTDKRGKTP